jgi:hypothetical protein
MILPTAVPVVVESNPVMKRTSLSLAIALFLFVAVHAQEPAQANPPDKKGVPVVQFVLDWRAQNPPRYSVAVASDGRATYRSEPAADPNGGTVPDPYLVEWTVTEPTRTKIFEYIEKLNYFQNANFESKLRVARTGLKTLTYRDQTRDNSVTYNYSENPAVRDLTHIFQSIAATAELGRKLTHDLRYDKLGVDADLKALQEQHKVGDAIEFGSIAPILQRIVDDPNMMRMSQQRAKDLLRTSGVTTQATTAGK